MFTLIYLINLEYVNNADYIIRKSIMEKLSHTVRSEIRYFFVFRIRIASDSFDFSLYDLVQFFLAFLFLPSTISFHRIHTLFFLLQRRALLQITFLCTCYFSDRASNAFPPPRRIHPFKPLSFSRMIFLSTAKCAVKIGKSSGRIRENGA